MSVAQGCSKRSNTSGIAADEMIPRAKMQHILDADRSGLHVAVHAIGDDANLVILNMYEEVEKQNGARAAVSHRARAASQRRRHSALR